jgi:DNA-binding response OmpR family regulator
MTSIIQTQLFEPLPWSYQSIIGLISFISVSVSLCAGGLCAGSRSCEGSLKIGRAGSDGGSVPNPGCHHGRMDDDVTVDSAAAGSLPGGDRPKRGLRAMVVEDEQELARVLGSYLERDGFDVTLAHDGRQAVTSAREVDPDVIVLDLGLPGLDGIEVCRQVRTFSDAYVVMLTARTDEVDVLIGLSVGADDYMTKPFSPRELMARLQAMLRRPRAPGPSGEVSGEVRTFGPLRIDPLGREVRLDGEPVSLTRTEFDLLSTLSGRPKMAFSRRQLIEDVWGPAWVGDEHLVDVHLGHLRRKLGDDAAEGRYVRTVRGVGYRMGSGK